MRGQSFESKIKAKKRGIKYAAITFLLWVISPLILAFLVYLINSTLLNSYFIFNLILPAFVLAVIAFGISHLRQKALRKGAYYSLIGAMTWASPSIYFLPGMSIYPSLSFISKLLIVIVPSLVLAILFFFIGKNQNSEDNLSALYVKDYIYSKNK